MAKFLALLALVWLVIGIVATYVPWRSWLRISDENTIIKERLKRYQENMIDSVIEPMDFRGGWFQGGRVEASFMLGAIILGMNAIGLSGAENRSQAGFILVGIAMLWTLISSWQLQKVLMADSESELARSHTGLDENTEVAYSDAENDKGLLVDENNGLRGRPDQIVILDGEFIPVEQKTGKVPHKPHYSHKMQIMAYIHLVEVTTGKTPPFGILSYGGDNNHQILWDDYNRKMLADGVKEIQRLMVEGGAKRNHDRPGKCRSCSRRHACPDNLLEVQS
jgi:CRISPR-associated exonuclease Cas4